MNPLSPVIPKTGFKFVLTVREGPDLGVSYQLLPPRVTIGRGPECNVALTDPRVSRMAAVIEFTMERIVISDLSNRQTLQVNGDYVNEASIKDSDVIQIGDTQMTFFVEAMKLAPVAHGAPIFPQFPGPASMPPTNAFPSPIAHPGHEPHHAQRPPPRVPSMGGLSSRQKFYIGIAVAGAAFAYLMMSEETARKKEQGLRTVEQIEKEIKDSEERQEDIIKKRIPKNEDEKTRIDEAARHFQEGFRDYQKGFPVRAMRSFETAKTIDPQHPLAGRYYKLAEKQRDEMAAELTLEGRRYREKKMWGKCSSSFDKALSLMPNREDVKFKANEALKKECDLNLDVKFRY